MAGRRRASAYIVGLVLLAVAASGCGGMGTRRPPEPEAVSDLVWPWPPSRARVRFVKTVARPEDLGIKPSVLSRLAQLIVGREEEWLIRPTAVAARGPVMYIADPGAQAVWVIDARAGRFRKIQKANAESLVSPVAVAVGADGRVYVADSYLAKIFVYGADLSPIMALAGPNLHRPAGLAFDGARNRLYVADSAAHQVLIYTGDDGRPMGAIGRRGSGDGEFNFPTHVAVDRSGTIYVTDSLGFRVQIFEAAGGFAAAFGRHGDSAGDFARPKGVALDSEGHIYVVEALFDAVQIFDRRGRFLLSFGERGVARGQFWLPAGISIDADDRIYVADAYNQRIQVFQYLAGGGDD